MLYLSEDVKLNYNRIGTKTISNYLYIFFLIFLINSYSFTFFSFSHIDFVIKSKCKVIEIIVRIPRNDEISRYGIRNFLFFSRGEIKKKLYCGVPK